MRTDNTLRMRLVSLKTDADLARAQETAHRKGHWTLEDLELAERTAQKWYELFTERAEANERGAS